MNILNFFNRQLDKLKIKTKLLVFMALPFLVIICLGIIQISHHYQAYTQAKQGRQFISISLTLESLMVELQKERGLTEFYITSPNPAFKLRVDRQRIKTNALLSQFDTMSAKFSQKISLNSSLADETIIQNKFNQTQNLIAKLFIVRSHIDHGSSEGAFAFYSTLVAKIIDIIENIEVAQHNPLQGRLTGDFINLLWLIERSGQERGALNGILASKRLNIEKLQLVLNYISAQDEAIERFLSTAPRSEQNALLAILAAQEHLEITKIRNKIAQKIARDDALSQIKGLIGFNGIIHHLKDFTITGDKHYLESIKTKLVELNDIIYQLEHQYLINNHDLTAISAMKTLSHTFEVAVNKANEPPFSSPEFTASTARQLFDESTVQQALEHLQRGQLDISEKSWWTITTTRLEAIRAVNNNIQQQRVDNAQQLENNAVYALFFSTAIIFTTLFISLFLCYFILHRVVGEIGNIVRFMKKSRHHHHFNEKITITGNDEITDMEQAYNDLLAERQQSEHLTRISAAVFEHASEAIFITDAHNIIEEVNPAFSEITGYSAEEVIGKSPSIFKSDRHDDAFYLTMWQNIQEHGNWQGEVWNKRKNGQIFPEYLAISVVKDPNNNIVQHIALFSDISKHKQYEQDIWHQANYDSLTKLPNRNLLSNRLVHELKLMQRQKAQLAILFIDLDRFKYVNDTYGHSFGDELIIAIATKFEDCVRKSDTIARLGGDEFIILLPNIKQIYDIEKIANKVLRRAAEPIGLSNGHQAIVTASIGISIYPNDADDAESLLKHADAAMYQAKENGKNNFFFYTPEINEDISLRMQLDMELRQAIAKQEFVLHYQPIYCLKEKKVLGVEALVRWQHPSRGLIYPDAFINVAEDTGLIIEIGEQVLEQAANDLNILHQQGHKIQVSVNISGRQCLSTINPIAQQISHVIKKYQLPAEYLHIEITESMLMENTQHTKDIFNAIKKLGVQIYMDDFGTGYSSLSYLKQFPIDVLKIDRSFIWKMLEDKADADLVKAIIMIGHNLHLKLVAEGVETQAHLEYLAALGCDYIQGYHISKPQPLTELFNFLTNFQCEAKKLTDK